MAKWFEIILLSSKQTTEQIYIDLPVSNKQVGVKVTHLHNSK